MFEISFVAGMITVLLGWLVYRAAAYRKHRAIDWKFEGWQLFFLVNLLVIVRFTFYPFSTVNGKVQPLIFDVTTAWPFRMNLVPFVNLLQYDSKTDLLINLIGNFAMFIPTGVMVPLIYKKRKTFAGTVLTGAILSFAIEVIQLPFGVRASDVDDLILNIAGCVTGYGLYASVKGIVSLVSRKKTR